MQPKANWAYCASAGSGEGRDERLDLLRGFCAEQTTAVIACHDRDVIELPDMQRLHLVDHTLRQALPPTS